MEKQGWMTGYAGVRKISVKPPLLSVTMLGDMYQLTTKQLVTL